MSECRFNEVGRCITHSKPDPALCFVGKAELEAQLRSLEHDLRNQQQAAMSESENAELLESRLRESEAKCASQRKAITATISLINHIASIHPDKRLFPQECPVCATSRVVKHKLIEALADFPAADCASAKDFREARGGGE